MATTGIWKISKRLDHVIDYVSNPDKTIKDNVNYQELHKFNEYDNLNYNTEEECYISGINCLSEDAYEDMMDTKKIWKKHDGILGYHAFQSFAEGEITADKAHLIGIKLAEELWGDRFEVLVTTHINTNHIHNHFVINSVSFKDGKKYNDCHESYALFRKTSDILCEEYGLKVLKNNEIKTHKVNYENYYKKYVNRNNYHNTAKQDLDRAIGMAYSYKDFENIMIKMGYEVKNRYGKLSIIREPFKKYIRIERAFGTNYSISEIEKRIEKETIPRVPFIEAYNSNNKDYTYESPKKEKTHGLYGLYKYYCYILGVYSKQYPSKVLPPSMRIESYKLNEISKQTRLLVDNKIKTYDEFLFFKDNLNTEIKELNSQKEYLWKRIKRIKDNETKEEIMEKLNSINKTLNDINQNYKLCEGIEKRSGIIEENIKEFEENEKGAIKR